MDPTKAVEATDDEEYDDEQIAVLNELHNVAPSAKGHFAIWEIFSHFMDQIDSIGAKDAHP